MTDQNKVTDRALQEAVALLDELNERKSSRDFYGINQTLHAKLATIRATLARSTQGVARD